MREFSKTDPQPWIGPMNILPFEQQVQVIASLVDGCSIRATERMTGVHRDTIMRLAVRVGEGCARIHDEMMRSLQVNLVEMDEAWAYIGKKQKRLTPDDAPEKGDCYTFIAMDATRKAILSYRVGKRDGENTVAFCQDLRDRIVGRPQISSDAWAAYADAIERAFGAEVDYAQIVKSYEGEPAVTAARRYSPGWVVSVHKHLIAGRPAKSKVSTSFVERQNLSLRMQQRRFTRLTNGFSKKYRNHAAAVSLYVAHYNLCRVHEALRMTPGLAIMATDHIWPVAELVEAALMAEDSVPLAA